MRTFKFDKLVRDKIVDHLLANSQVPQGVKTLAKEEFITELVKKVLEEANELVNAKDRNELIEEIADVQELLNCLQKVLGLSDADVQELQRKKVIKNGAFEKQLYIDLVGVNEDDSWMEYYLSQPEKYPEIVGE